MATMYTFKLYCPDNDSGINIQAETIEIVGEALVFKVGDVIIFACRDWNSVEKIAPTNGGVISS